MNIIEQIKALPAGEWAHEVTNTLDTDDLKALAESHERLLAAAKVVVEDLDRLGGRCNPLSRASGKYLIALHLRKKCSVVRFRGRDDFFPVPIIVI